MITPPQVEGAHYVDAGAVTVAIAALFGWLPNIAAMLTVIWMVIRIWETETVRNWVKREQRAHELKVYAEAKVKQAAKEEVIEMAKEAVKPEVVEAVVAALPIDPLIAMAVKEKVLNDGQLLNVKKD